VNGWDKVGDSLAVEFNCSLVLLLGVLMYSGLHQLRLSHRTHNLQYATTFQ